MVLMIVLVQQKKKLVLTLVKQRQTFALVYNTMYVHYLYVNKTKICRFKVNGNMR